MKKKLTKDVPNSIIDGLSLGKPVIMTNVVDFAKDVVDYDMGWVVKPGEMLDLDTIKRAYIKKCGWRIYEIYSKDIYENKKNVIELIKFVLKDKSKD